jgi:tripartite-type tricarboxylate transporter receptor subunit TctC
MATLQRDSAVGVRERDVFDLGVRIIGDILGAFVTVLEDPEPRDRIVAVGADPTPSTSNEFAAFITSETTKWKQVISVSGAMNN